MPQPAPKQWTLYYNGGPLLATDPGSQVVIYLLFYGPSWTESQRDYFRNLARHIGDSSWYNTVTQYMDANGHFVQSGARFGGEYNDPLSHGYTIDDSDNHRDLQDVLGTAFNNPEDGSTFARDPNGVYMMLLAPEITLIDSQVQAGGGACAYHKSSLVGAQVYAALPGNVNWAGNCPTGGTTSPLTYGGSTGTWMDEVADSFVHEMFEGITDPYCVSYLDQSGTGYQDYVSPPPLAAGGVENEDICQNVYGNNLLTTPSGRPANIKLGNQFYLIQSAFTMSYPNNVGYCSWGAPYTPGDDVIAIQSAVYGENCTTTAFADITATVRATCNGKFDCPFLIPTTLPSSPGCAGRFTVQWACWDGPHIATQPSEAKGFTIDVSCPAP